MYGAIMLGFLAIIVLVTVIWAIQSYKDFLNLRYRAETAYALMDDILRKRYDLVFKIAGVIRCFEICEKGVLERVVAAGNMALTSRTPDETLKNNYLFVKAMKNMFSLAENSLELQQQQGYQGLLMQLSELETELNEARVLYNKMANQYNERIVKFPGNLIAGILSFQMRPLYEEAV